MKKSILFGAIVTILAGCSVVKTEKPPILSMANPASEYCISQGGNLKIENTLDGQVGYCKLPNGEVVEEWAFFHESQDKCIAEKTEQLVGQKLSDLSERDVKEITNADVVRIVQPNQMVTADFQQNRVTILVDPETNKVIKATCG